jgi:hypothetical protein
LYTEKLALHELLGGYYDDIIAINIATSSKETILRKCMHQILT